MPVNQQKGRQSRRQVAFGLTIMAGLIAQSFAQEAAPAAPAQDDANMTVVQVSGYRNSLLSSAKDKKEAVGFRDSINSEDFGKFPDKNIAESLSRIRAWAWRATSPAKARPSRFAASAPASPRSC
jgi:hypothetical protein